MLSESTEDQTKNKDDREHFSWLVELKKQKTVTGSFWYLIKAKKNKEKLSGVQGITKEELLQEKKHANKTDYSKHSQIRSEKNTIFPEKT